MFNSYVSLPEGTPCNSRIFPLKAPWLVGDSQEIATFYHISRWYFPVFRCISMYFHISPWYHDSSQYTMILPMIFPWYSHDIPMIVPIVHDISHENFPSRWDTTAAQLLRRWSAWALSRWKVPVRRGSWKKPRWLMIKRSVFKFMIFMAFESSNIGRFLSHISTAPWSMMIWWSRGSQLHP